MRYVYLFASILFLTSCSTITGSYQRVKIVSEPEGAQIIHEGKVLGETPQYVKLRRRKNSDIRLQFSNKDIYKYKLNTRYRWVESGASNLIWMSWLTPAGWLTDLLTQSSWEYHEIGLLVGSDELAAKKQKLGPKKIVIAPPLADYEVLSDEIGDLVESKIRARFKSDNVIPYRDTLGIFERFDYSYRGTSPPKYRDDLYEELQNHYIVETQTDKTGKTIKLKTKVFDIFREEQVAEFNEDLPLETLAFNKRSLPSKMFGSLASLLPNSVGLDFSISRPEVRVDSDVQDQPYTSEGLNNESVTKYLSSISLRNIRGNTYVNRFHFVFDWSTAVSLSHRNLQFQSTTAVNPLKNITYSWFTAYGGIGPQLGLSSPVGYFYLDLVPILATSFVSWKNSGHYKEVNRAYLALQMELGYSFFISRNINARIAATSKTVNGAQWEDVIERTLGERRKVFSSTITTSGLTISYFIPEGRAALRSLF